MKKNKKYLFAFLLSVLFLPRFFVGASDDYFTIGTLKYDKIPEVCKNTHQLILDAGSTKQLICSPTDIFFANGKIFYGPNYYLFNLRSDSTWEADYRNPISNSSFWSLDRGHNIYLNTREIKDTNGEVIQKKYYPKVPMSEVIAEIQMSLVLKEVLQLIPIVVLSIVSFLGLRKAWRFCLSQLRSL